MKRKLGAFYQDWPTHKNFKIHKYCSTFASPHKPTLKPKACKRAAIIEHTDANFLNLSF